MKKALILGGSGRLSSVLAKMAMKEYEVWTVTRGLRALPEGVKPIIADRDCPEAFEKAVLAANTEWDVVFDCIAQNAEHAALDLKVLPKVTRRLVAVSTDSVYSPYHKKTPENEEGIYIEEEGPTETVSYGCNKRRMEVAFMADAKSENPLLRTTLFRPGHIYGPGFVLGCFPENSREEGLPDKILRGEHLRLVGMGTYLIQPIYAEDLARVMLECVGNEKTFGEIFCIGGPEAVENRRYYEILGEALGVRAEIDEVPLKGYLEAHPEYSGHLVHRIYDLSKLKATGIRLPDTHLEDGLRIQLRAMGYQTV